MAWPGHRGTTAAGRSSVATACSTTDSGSVSGLRGPSGRGGGPVGTDEPLVGGAVPPLVVRSQGSDRSLPAGPSYRVGRDPESDIVITDARVSWQHAVLTLENGCWVLVDTGSTNGTFAADQRVDRIEISGECLLARSILHSANRRSWAAVCRSGQTSARSPAGPSRKSGTSSKPCARSWTPGSDHRRGARSGRR
jgi:FHA domain